MDYNIPDNKKTGILLNDQNIKLQRLYFNQMCDLIGIVCLYRTPIKNMKQYTLHGELDSKYNPAEVVKCIYNEHVDQKTSKKLGWNAERDEQLTIISVPYDLHDLQKGCLFVVPSGLDNSKGRVFRVVDMSVIPVFPASITCKLGPVMEDELEPAVIQDFTKSDMNALREGDVYDEEDQ